MNPLVSILVPVYGVARYVEQFAHSLLNQSYENLEIIIVNDASPDRSMDILHRVAARYPERGRKIRYIDNERNLKVSTTRNEALALASGKYILQVDSDDWMEREMVEKMTRMAEERNADIVWCDYFQNYETKEKICSQTCEENSEFCTRKLLLSELHPAFWNKLIKRELYVKNQVACVPGINFCEDMVCTVRLFAAAKRVAYLPEPLYHYRYSPNSITKWLTLRDYEEQFILHSVLRHDLPAGKYDREVLLREIGILAEIAVRYPEAESLKKIDQISREEIQQAPLHWSKKKLLLARKQKQKIRFLGLQKLLKCLIISRAWLRRINA